MNQGPHFAFLMLLAFSIIYSHRLFVDHFTGDHSNKKVVEKLLSDLDEQKTQNQLLAFQFSDFRAEVANILGQEVNPKLPTQANYPLRTLASVVQVPNRDELIKLKAFELLQNGKANFRAGEHEKAVICFLDFIRDHSYSAYLPEAYFLLNESFFVLNRWEEVIKTTDKMVEIFPENELTGFALLRAGKVYEMQDKPSQAVEIYKTVLKVFPSRSLASQAKMSIEATDL